LVFKVFSTYCDTCFVKDDEAVSEWVTVAPVSALMNRPGVSVASAETVSNMSVATKSSYEAEDPSTITWSKSNGEFSISSKSPIK
jgi:hypothetical protein